MPSADEPWAAPCDPQALVRLVRAGDLRALDRVTRCHGERLLAVGRRYCRDHAEAEDAVQDALLAAGRHLDSFRGDGSVEGWLVRMVANACHHMRRGRKNARHMQTSVLSPAGAPGRDGDEAGLLDVGAALESPLATPEQQAMAGQLASALGEALQEFDATTRAVVLLAEAEGWTGPEIAAELGLTPGAVRVRLTRARARLRERLAPRWAEPRAVASAPSVAAPS